MRHYASEASERWVGFDHRPGDVVISTRTKSGTTWMQMICALLVFGTPDLPARLADLSPWLDWAVEPLDVVTARLAGQSHRRFIKTHTPLDGLPLDPQVNYVVVARHPLDVAVSMYHHVRNLDRVRQGELTGRTSPPSPAETMPVDEWVTGYVASTSVPEESLDSLPGVLHHLTDTWARRGRPNVVLVHYQDLQDDLAGQMRELADRLHIEVRPDRWPALVEAASFPAMQARAEALVPDSLGVLRDRDAFFRSGRSGEGRALLGPEAVARYERRAAQLAPADLLAWLHR